MKVDEPSFEELLTGAQEYITKNYANIVGLNDKASQEKTYWGVQKYLQNIGKGENERLARRLYNEMAQFSILTSYLGRADVEEIDVNSWQEIVVQFTDGRREKLTEGFISAQRAIDIVKRLLRLSGTVMDASSPVAEGSLPKDSRIAAVTVPIVEESIGVSCSIRLLHPTKRTLEDLIENKTANSEMMDILKRCFEGKVSFVIAGSTDAGKTTLLGALLQTLPESMRLFVIESGTREFSFRKKEDSARISNVVHTLSNTDHSGNISQEKLVETALRFNPDAIIVGEMRDVEAFSVVEAAGSGHMVVSTVHASSAKGAITRIAMLSKKKYAMDFQTAYLQSATAFPLVVTLQKGRDKQRRIVDISEVHVDVSGQVSFLSIFSYQKGVFVQKNKPSMEWRRKLYDDEMD